MSRTRASTLKWRLVDGLHVAHAREGMWAIELHRGRHLVTLDLFGARGATQDMGSYKSLAMAKAVAGGAHKKIATLVQR